MTLVLIFMFQSEVILKNYYTHNTDCNAFDNSDIFDLWNRIRSVLSVKTATQYCSTCRMIGASNFFELAVAVAIALFGTTSEAALATTVGVLTEVPVMLMLVRIANKTKGRFL